VLATIANIFATHEVSIEFVEQTPTPGRKTANLEIGTHEATDASLSAVVAALAASDAVESITSVIRLEGL
jgi:homoserine dehydrogenase